jgi:nucleotide-binding universal stress UspA family protein
MHVVLKRICVPTDFSEAADHALHYGATLAEQNGAELHLVHVLQDASAAYVHADFTASGDQIRDYFHKMELAELGPRAAQQPAEQPDAEVSEYLRALERGTQEEFAKLPVDKWWERVKVFRTVRFGNAVKEICGYARRHEIDLLVMGTHGRTGLKRLLVGSVTERVVRVATCPVLVVRKVEHEFVVDD